MSKLFGEQSQEIRKGFTLENASVPTGRSQRWTNEELATISMVATRSKTFEDGGKIVNAIVFFNNGKPAESHKISPYCEAFTYPDGTQIDPNSMVWNEFQTTNGLTTTVTCRKK